MGHKRPGFTLIELTLAVTITAVTGLSIAGVMMTLSRAHEQSQIFHQSVQAGRCVMRNVGQTIRQAKLVTACDEHSITLWTNDNDGNGEINPSELAVIYYDPESRELRQVAMEMDSLSPALKAAVDQPVPLYSLTNAEYSRNYVNASAYAVTRPLAANVTSMRFFLNRYAPLTRTVGLEADITRGGQTLGFRTAVTTRAGFEQYVGVSDGDYVLMPIY
jgi:type II secretory pathway pseudopilin PulG